MADERKVKSTPNDVHSEQGQLRHDNLAVDLCPFYRGKIIVSGLIQLTLLTLADTTQVS